MSIFHTKNLRLEFRRINVTSHIGLLLIIVLSSCGILYQRIEAQDGTAAPSANSATQTDSSAQVSFSQDIAPILYQQCVACHNAKKAEGGYRLDSYRELLKQGDSAEAPVTAGQPLASLLLQRIATTDPSERMPPETDALSADQVQAIRQWIQSGANFDGKEPAQPLVQLIPAPRYRAPPARYPEIPITALTFSADGQHILCGGYHELTIWDWSSRQLIRRIDNIGQRVYAIDRHADGNLLAVACGQPGRWGEVRLVEYGSGTVLQTMAHSTDVLLDVKFRPGREELGIASTDNSVRVINYQSLQQVAGFASHADWVLAVAFSADGNKLASASRDKTVKLYDLESGQMIANYTAHGAPVRGVAFSPDSANLFTVGDDKKVHRWNAADSKKIIDLPIEAEGFRPIALSDGILIPSASKRVMRIDLASNKITKTYTGPNSWVVSCAQASDGRIAAGCIDGTVYVWNADGQPAGSFTAAP